MNHRTRLLFSLGAALLAVALAVWSGSASRRPPKVTAAAPAGPQAIKASPDSP